jgi:DNA end-binding protein Ku
MKFADEVVDPADVPELEVDLPEIDAKARAMATSLIDSLTTEFEPTKFSDTYTDDLRALIETKARGETITPVERPAASPRVVDLMAALEASVAAAKAARGEDDGAAPAKPRKKRSTAA